MPLKADRREVAVLAGSSSRCSCASERLMANAPAAGFASPPRRRAVSTGTEKGCCSLGSRFC